MKNLIKKAIVGAGLFAATLIGCDNYDSLAEQELKNKGFTQEQAEVLTAVSYRPILTDEIKTEDGAVTYKINYGGITEEDVLIHISQMHKDLDETLEMTVGSIPDLKFMKNTGIGEHLLKQERIYNYLEDTISKKLLYKKFKELSEQSASYSAYDPLNVNENDRYSLATVFPINQKELEFDMEYVKTARAAGKLRDPNAVSEEITEQQTFYEQVKNPKFPVFDKYREWELRKRSMNLKITSYNLDNDGEMEADYVEAYRLKDGKQESKPAIKIFKSRGVGNLEVLVADRDFEGTEGFGIPDMVERVGDVTTGSDILYSDATEFIFQDSRKEKPIEPNLESINKIYIVGTGSILTEKYDINPKGWESYLPDYKSGKKGKKFAVHIKLSGEEDDEVRKIEWIAKRYYEAGRVVEFYKPGRMFSSSGYSVIKTNERVLSLVGASGKLEQYDVDAMIESKPYKIDFDRNQQKRWMILDKDGDRNHYEAKQEVAWPWDVIPDK